MQNIVRPFDIRLNSLHGKKLAGRNLLKCRRMENIVYARHYICN